jgi:alpha-tubulin suppressor-like RCC1 family protein
MGRIVSIHANRGFACGISEDKRVYCWGNNYYGQLGDGTTENHATPVLVEGLPAVEKLALGGTHACALTDAATVFCWGDNRAQQLGKSAPNRVLSPRLMRGLGAVEQIALGNRSSCFRRNNRTVVCMGSNHLGELGCGISSKELQTSGSPKLVQGLPPVR